MSEWYLPEQIPRVPQPLRIRKIIGVPLNFIFVRQNRPERENYQEQINLNY